MEASQQELEKERKESMNYSKSIEAEYENPKDKLRDQYKLINLGFDGIIKYEDKSWRDAKKNLNLKGFLYQKLNVQRVGIERAHRPNKPKSDGLRTTVVKFNSSKIKQLIINNASS